MQSLRDTWLLFKHYLTMTMRNPVMVIVGLFQPIVQLLLFAPLLEPIANTEGFPEGGSIGVFTPGLLVMLGITGSLFVVFGFIAELRAGVLERMRVTPLSRLALVLGRLLRDVVMLLLQATVLVGVAWLMGLRADPAGVALSMLIVVLLGLLVSSCSYAVALILQDENAVASVLNFLILPILLLSGITLPLTLAPNWIQNVAGVNPFAYAVDASRALFIGQFSNPAVWQGFVVMGVLAFLGVFWAVRSFRQGVA
ncbi:ABC transporter permease [Herpetosiphon llansteffanensis]|uniref:ABC transporter permease n=1 Tax=Herpetosiphon llansteffanensis TaxID=2094568 RepID=UPI000D7BD4F6|nr:ABC transporter permease [Herpetosiphon llansteffanensis]